MSGGVTRSLSQPIGLTFIPGLGGRFMFIRKLEPEGRKDKEAKRPGTNRWKGLYGPWGAATMQNPVSKDGSLVL